MKVSWADVSHTEAPGSFRLFNGVVEINHQHIAIWKSEPTALSTAIPAVAISD